MNKDFTIEDARRIVRNEYDESYEITDEKDLGYKYLFYMKDKDGYCFSVSVDDKFPHPVVTP